MKELLLISLLVCVAFASCDGSDTDPTEEELKIDEKCLKDNKLKSHPNFGSGFSGLTDNDKCYMKCVAEAFIAAKDDSMITDYSDKINDPVKVEKLKSTLDDCMKLLVDTTCDAFAKTFLCIRTTWIDADKEIKNM